MHWWAVSDLGRLQFWSRVELDGSFWEMWSRERERRGARLWVRRRYRFVAVVQVHRDPTKREELPLEYWWFGCSSESRVVYDLSSSVSVYESRFSKDDIRFRGSFPWDPIRYYYWLRFYTDFLPVWRLTAHHAIPKQVSDGGDVWVLGHKATLHSNWLRAPRLSIRYRRSIWHTLNDRACFHWQVHTEWSIAFRGVRHDSKAAW